MVSTPGREKAPCMHECIDRRPDHRKEIAAFCMAGRADHEVRGPVSIACGLPKQRHRGAESESREMAAGQCQLSVHVLDI